VVADLPPRDSMQLSEVDLSRMLALAAAGVLGDDEPIVRSARGSRVIPDRQRLWPWQLLASVRRISPRCSA
jgi:hypothetical protein